METVSSSSADLVMVDGQYFDLNQVRDIMQNEEELSNYRGPSRIGYLSKQLGITPETASDLFLKLSQKNNTQKIANNIKSLNIIEKLIGDTITRRKNR